MIKIKSFFKQFGLGLVWLFRINVLYLAFSQGWQLGLNDIFQDVIWGSPEENSSFVTYWYDCLLVRRQFYLCDWPRMAFALIVADPLIVIPYSEETVLPSSDKVLSFFGCANSG